MHRYKVEIQSLAHFVLLNLSEDIYHLSEKLSNIFFAKNGNKTRVIVIHKNVYKNNYNIKKKLLLFYDL